MAYFVPVLLGAMLALTACAQTPADIDSAVSHAVPSPGCGRAPPANAPSTVAVNGRQRGFILALPPNYRADQPHALVLAFHGRTNSNAKVRGYYDLEPHATRPTIFVYPSGIAKGRSYSWSRPGDNAASLRDFALFDALLTRLSAEYCVATNNVFAVGHSLGAWFANSLACARGERLRAVASVAGGISAERCSGRAAALLIHNPNDRLVPIGQGLKARDRLLAQNGLAARPALALAGDLNCRRHGNAERYPVIWCPHRQNITWRGRYYPHQWPRGTGKRVMQFFESLPSK